MTRKLSTGTGTTALYFAFPDGVFNYVCAECTALCCKGHGFGGSLEKELRPLFVLYPQIESMAIRRQGDFVEFTTPSSGCLLLDSDNWCRIEKDHSKAAKPSICNLFPFNSFMQIGNTIAVRPHFLCPLRIQVPARPGNVEGTHETLETVIRSSPIINSEFMSTRKPPFGMHPSANATSTLEREISFRDLCSLELGQSRFAEVLKTASADPDGLDGFVKRAAQVLGLPVPSQPRDSVDDLLIALAPPLRLEMLHLSSEAILRALLLGEIIFRQALSLSRIALTPQGAYTLLFQFGPALRLLAHADEPVDLPASANVVAPPFGDSDMIFAAFLALRDIRGTGGVLNALEKSIKPSFTVSDRSILINQIGSEIEEIYKKRRKKR
ncbi:MAG: YkgJ family cysteine cluster protein [Blastocatellia bacterium]